MPVLFRIAFRNLLLHRAKSLIIGIIIAVGIAILVVGNSMIDTSAEGIQKTFIDSYTGHIMISGKTESALSLFGASGMGNIEDLPSIPEYDSVKEYVNNLPETAGVTSQVSGFSTISLEEVSLEEIRVFTILFGIEPESYKSLFDNLEIVEGRYLETGEEGIMLSTGKIKDIENELGVLLKPGDTVLLNNFGNAGFKIREVPIRGVFRFKTEGEGMNMLSYVDVQTLRSLLGMTVGSIGEVEVSEEETAFLDVENMDSLFEEDLVLEEQDQTDAVFEEAELLTILGDTAERDRALRVDTGSWHFILLKLDSPRKAGELIPAINSWLQERGIEARAVDWEKAAGPFASSAKILKTVFNIAILIVAIVAVIIIMNTLIISGIERTAEIGTMRALGARKGFIWKMFITETLTITILFGIIGIILGIVILFVLGLLHIEANNPFLEILFAGKVLEPRISPSSVLYALATVVAIGVIAHLYPVFIALKVQPVKAIQTE